MPENNGSDFIPGIPVDARGNPTIDPTKNVLDLVRAESLRQDGLRDAQKEMHGHALSMLEKFQNFARDSESKLQTWQRQAESVRIDQLAQLRQVYETRIAEMLAVSVKSTSDLVSTQLVQIQATFNDRVSKLEQFRWESGGSRDRDQDRRGNIGSVVGIATLCSLLVSIIVGAVMWLVAHTSSPPPLAPVPAAVAVVPVQPNGK